ncbi:hypothetical protein [Halorubrum aethiopicum]|uniref:hypothetical protein n=1 Tax=Halorubrum aethiopicum TaxID=1758255 RepID=UPI00082F386A|nr:hypothetical protein [Halorubrum aethiopicum]
MSDARCFDQDRKDAAGGVASDVRARLREWYGVADASLVSVETAKGGAYETGGEYDPVTFLDYAGVDWLVDTNNAILPVGERIRPNVAGRRDFSWRVANGCTTPCESDRVPAGIDESGLFPRDMVFGLRDEADDHLIRAWLIDVEAFRTAVDDGRLTGERHARDDGTAAVYYPVADLVRVGCIRESWAAPDVGWE